MLSVGCVAILVTLDDVVGLVSDDGKGVAARRRKCWLRSMFAHFGVFYG